MSGSPGLGTAGPVSQPPCASHSADEPAGMKRGGWRSYEIVVLSCGPAYSRYGNWSLTSTWYSSAVGWLFWVDQLAPPSSVTLAPPSLDSMKTSGLSGLIHMSWLSPWGTRCWVQLFPPSIDFQKPSAIAHRTSGRFGSA